MSLIGEFFGYMAGLLSAICFLPQAVKTIRIKDVAGLSGISYSIYTLAMISWTIYGVFMHSVPMMFFNSISAVFAGCILYTILTERKKK